MNTIALIPDFILRPITPEDADQLLVVKNNREAAAWLEQDNNGYTRQDIETWIHYHNAQETNLILGIEDTRQHTLIGHAGLYDMDLEKGICTFGILIGLPEYWNRGVGRAATKAMIDIAFHTPGMRTIRLHVLSDHSKAIELYRSLGFERTGLLEQHTIKNGVARDVLIMELHHYAGEDIQLY